MKRKLTPEEREDIRRVDEEGRAAQENMQRILDDLAVRRGERLELGQKSFLSRLLGRRTA
jgi:hypothetical protein